MTHPTDSTVRTRMRAGITLAAALIVGALVAVPLLTGSESSPSASEVAAAESRHDAATRDDAEFGRQFAHHFTTVDGVRMHYVSGGEGPPLVLLHGWPQTWFAWREIMPALAEHRTVYALDLPGLGDSEGAPRGFDKKTLATYIHALLNDHLDLGPVDLVGHDLGAGVGFQYAAQFPDAVRRYVHMDYPLPSSAALPAQTYRTFSWHMGFHSQPALPEELVDDPEDVRAYLEYFYTQVAAGGAAFGGDRTTSPFTPAEVEEFARTYSRPDVLRNGFELYRALDQDQIDNDRAGVVEVPTLLLTATGSLESTEPTLVPLFSDLQGAAEIPGAGHWLAEENPDAVVEQMQDFLLR